LPTSRRSKPKATSGVTIRQVRTKEDRKRPSVFIRLKAEEMFKGHALFEPDVELDDNPWYFEYFSHYDKQANQYVPCSGAKCPFCAANDNPSTRALTLWYFPEAANEADKIKVFEFNYTTTNDLIDEAEDEDGMLGKVVRVKRLNDGGDYKVKITADKPLLAKAKALALKEADVKFPNGLIALVERQLAAQMERLKALDALDDDEEDEDEEEEIKPKAKKGKPAPEPEDEEDDDDEEEDDEDDSDDEDDEDADEDEAGEIESIEDEEFDLLSVSKAKNSVKVEHDGETIELTGDDDVDVSEFKKGETVTISADYDEDEETWTLTEIAPAEEAEEEAEEEDDDDEEEEDDDDNEAEEEDDDAEADDEITGGVYTVVKVQEKDEIFDLTGAGGEKVKMWVGEGVKPDYEAITKGVSVKLDATQDDEGDWIITDISVAKKPRSKK
jgi:hypothetical protein